jgi:hypothetical protein
MEISIGEYSIPVVLAVVLMIIYRMVPEFPDRWKAVTSLLIGIALGLLSMVYTETLYTFQTVVNYILAGFFAGAAAVGLYEAQDKIRGATSTLKDKK